MSEDTPTERFTPPAPVADAAVVTSPPQGDHRKPRKFFIWIAVVGGLLVIALVIFLTLLVSRGMGNNDDLVATPSVSASATPSASSSPTDTPTETPSASPSTPPPPPPPSTDPTITTFTPTTTTVRCNTESPVLFPSPLGFKWITTNAEAVYFGVDTDDASAAPYFTDLPPSGNSGVDFPDGYKHFEYNCPYASYKYTLTVVGTDGKKASKTITVVNNGDTY